MNYIDVSELLIDRVRPSQKSKSVDKFIKRKPSLDCAIRLDDQEFRGDQRASFIAKRLKFEDNEELQPEQKKILLHNMLLNNPSVIRHMHDEPDDSNEEEKKAEEAEPERVQNLKVIDAVFMSKAKQSDSKKSESDNDFDSASLEIENDSSQFDLQPLPAFHGAYSVKIGRE